MKNIDNFFKKYRNVYLVRKNREVDKRIGMRIQ